MIRVTGGGVYGSRRAVPFNAADYTASAGVWTVAAVVTDELWTVGPGMFLWSVTIVNQPTSALATTLSIALPFGLTSQFSSNAVFRGVPFGLTQEVISANIPNGGLVLNLVRFAGQWPIGNTSVNGMIMFRGA